MSQSDFVSRGQALVAAGQFQEAVKVCRLGLLGRPTTVEGRVVLGQALLALKRFDEVLAEMRVALELDHSSVAAQVLRAEALLRKGDTHPAIEALHKARTSAPGDPRIMQLLSEAEHGTHRASLTHPAVGFVGSGDTKHYPQHTSGVGDEPSGPGNYTQPTSLQAPGSERRSSRRHAVPDPHGEARTEITPPPVILAVGDKSGTVEVDPELEGIEVPRDPDFDEIAAPPKARRPAEIGGARGSVKSSAPAKSASQAKAAKSPSPARAPDRDFDNPSHTIAGKKSAKTPVPTQALDIDEDDLEEIEDTPFPVPRPSSLGRKPGPGTAVRNAVAMPSGVIGEFGPSDRGKPSTLPPPFGVGAPSPARSQSTTAAPPMRGNPSAPPPNRPNPTNPPPMALGMPPAAPLPPAPRGPIAAALPTVAAAQPPPPFVQQQAPYPSPPNPASFAAAQRPTMAVDVPPMSPALQQTALAVDQLFGNDQNQNWSPAANEPTARPGELDPQILALMSGGAMNPADMPPPAAPLVAMDQIALQMPPNAAGMRTGVRRTRSRLQIVVWMLIGVIVIGGGVFAGLKIRAMRLDKQITAARNRATDLAKADTFNGWTAARDSLSGIVQASSTLTNRAALARTRALIAHEFGDGRPEAKTAVDELKGQGGLDAKIAAAFIALLSNDVKAARAAGEAAVQGSDADAGAQYVAGEAALLAGDTKVATAAMKLAADKEPRPLYGIGLARAHAAAYHWDEAIAALDKVRGAAADHPGAIIARARILSAAGRIAASGALTTELKGQLEQLIAESRQSAAQQARGVSPTQAAFASLALAHVELARGDIAAARKAVRGATDINLDDQRFAEETIETLYAIGDLALARTAAEYALQQYPSSIRARVHYAHVLVAQGRAADAVDMLTKQADTLAHPDALAARGHAYLAMGENALAAADFDAALKKVPTHEPALVGRAWFELASGDIEAATKRMAERMSAKGAPVPVATAYAATLRRAADAASRDQAKALLEKIVAGPMTPDAVRAQLELARIYRDQGEYVNAATAYEMAARNGEFEARFEGALLSIEYSKPGPGQLALEALLKEAGERRPPALVIETARARLLVGQHDDAAALLADADKMSSVERWKLDRERGRLALRKTDFEGAATALGRALDTCGPDIETFLLAVDVSMLVKGNLADRVKQLAAERLKGQPELHIINGKYLFAAEKIDEAEVAFKQAATELRKVKASNRRNAAADYGIALVAYVEENNVAAEQAFKLVIDEDPTNVDAYIAAAEIAKRVKNKKKAYEYARKAVQYNPDYAYAWQEVGQLAHELRDKKVLADAIARLTVIAPNGDELKTLQEL